MQNQKKRVLVVDDEEDLTWSISKHLQKDKDKYELFSANSGRSALEIMSQIPVNLVITDIRMPEINGLDLLVQIRDTYPNTKVIIMTAYGSSEVQEEANRRGCLTYIEKPFEINELRQLIHESIKERKGFKGSVSEFQLSDLIQLNCLGRMTACLTVTHELETGAIYFDEGNIIHSEVGDLEGEDALYEILSWESGDFKNLKDYDPPNETIIKGWQSLLLEGLRRKDESGPNKQQQLEAERESRMNNIQLQLESLLQVPGVILCSVFDPEGFSIASKINSKKRKEYNMRVLSPVFSNLIKQVETAGIEMELEQARDFIIEYKNAILKITRIPDKKEFLVILATLDNNLSVLRIEAKKYLKKLAQYM